MRPRLTSAGRARPSRETSVRPARSPARRTSTSSDGVVVDEHVGTVASTAIASAARWRRRSTARPSRRRSGRGGSCPASPRSRRRARRSPRARRALARRTPRARRAWPPYGPAGRSGAPLPRRCVHDVCPARPWRGGAAERADAVDHAPQVDVDDPVPIVGRHLPWVPVVTLPALPLGTPWFRPACLGGGYSAGRVSTERSAGVSDIDVLVGVASSVSRLVPAAQARRASASSSASGRRRPSAPLPSATTPRRSPARSPLAAPVTRRCVLRAAPCRPIMAFALERERCARARYPSAMARPRTPQPPIHLRSARMLDVDKGELVEPGDLLIDGEPHRRGRGHVGARRRGRRRPRRPHAAAGSHGHGGQPAHGRARPRQPARGGPGRPGGEDAPRAVANARRTLRSGFTTVRNLGLFVQTGGILLDVALKKAIDLGWIDGPRIVPAGHAITPDRRAPRPHDVPGVRTRTSCPSPSRRASPTASTRCARPCATRSSTAPSSSRCARRAASCRTPGPPVPSSTPTTSWRPSPTRRTGPASGWPPTPTATTASGPPSRPASTASSTAR